MKSRRLVLVGVCLLVSASAAAGMPHGAGGAPDGGFSQGPTVVGAGGTVMHGGGWTLDGTVGQPATGRITATAGTNLAAGFWDAIGVATPSGDVFFANGFDPSP